MFDCSSVARRLFYGSATTAFGLILTACASSTTGAGTPAGTPIHPQNEGSSLHIKPVSASRADKCSRARAPAPRGAQKVAKPTFKLDPAKRYVVSLATNCGAIEIELDVRQAPRTTASFAYLVKRGFYNDLTFHRVAAGFVIQGGDPNGDGSGGPGYRIVEEPPSDMRYTLGTVAMAKTATAPSGSSGSQFFIVTAPNAALPAQYALVGNVVGSFAGVDTIARLPTSPPQDGAPTIPVVIGRATLSSR